MKTGRGVAGNPGLGAESGCIPPTEFLPVAMGANIVGDRWNLLIVRELLVAPARFNELHRALPGLSRSLLSTRMRRLEASGIVRRETPNGSPRHPYLLTPRGKALEQVIEALGSWALAWALPAPPDQQPCVPLVLWHLQQSMDRSLPPARRVVVEFRFPRGVHQRSWLCIEPDGRDRAGLGAPDYDVDLVVTADPVVLEDLGTGRRTCATTLQKGDIAFDGSPALVAQFRRWFSPGIFVTSGAVRPA